MAIQLINVGNIANDGTGDDLREAMIKINQNFEELDLRDDEQTTASNLGATGEGIFSQRLNYDLQFKKIAGGDNILVTADDEKIIIAAPTIGIETISIIADSGSGALESADETLTVIGGTGITTNYDSGVLTITNTYNAELSQDTSPELGGNLDAQGFSISNLDTITTDSLVAGTITAGDFTGNLSGLVYGVDVRNIATYFEENYFDFGSISGTATNIIDWIVQNTTVDFGSFEAPNTTTIDLGHLV